jgi:glyoxylase-like metal-dependent hydrolase (beta-lactamase superfamily II)/rhodanese-related sulfurtransferase
MNTKMDTKSMDFKLDSKIEAEDYFIQQFVVGELSQFSYYIESDKQAIIIDPIRDVQNYIEFINSRGSVLKYIILTHIHADFVSGHLELKSALESALGLEVKIIMGNNTQFGEDIKRVKEEDQIPLGGSGIHPKINLKVLETPGHTKESISVILINKKNEHISIFTGDCLFLGEVGRPDLSVESDSNVQDMAGLLYESIQKIKNLQEDIIIFPAHGAGSLCGSNIGPGTSDTLKNQKKINYALKEISKNQFIQKIIDDLSPPPSYYNYVVEINKYNKFNDSSNILQNVINKSKIGYDPEIFKNFINEDIIILDVRDIYDAMKAFIKGSYILTLNMPFCFWIATLFKPDQKIILITEPGKEEETIRRIARVGYENIVGYLEGGFNNFYKYCAHGTGKGELDGHSNLLKKFIVDIQLIPGPEVKHVATGGYIHKYELLDVREENEWKSTGIVPNSHLLSLKYLEKNISYLNAQGKDKTWAVYCKSGARATCAASILKKYGFNVEFLKGIENLKDHNVELIPYQKNKIN